MSNERPPTSAPLRIPDGSGGWLWLKMGSLLAGCPVYEADARLSSGFVPWEGRKRAMDLFCCAGGATRGLQQAGYIVTGVDMKPQPRYIGDHFFQDDAMAWLRGERAPLEQFDLIWASPPCQRYSQITPKAMRGNHPDLLPDVLAILRAQSIPYIVENVEGTQGRMRNPIMLCGSMFGLPLQRHRWFEVGNTDAFFLLPPCNHSEPPVLITGTTRRLIDGKRREFSLAECAAAAGIDWMRRIDLDEAIPPAYSRFLAEQMQLAPMKEAA